MKIRINQLRPNPFRNIDEYPINDNKVAGLVKSIKHTTFWDNILARKSDGVYEIAYGHHRLKALHKIYGEKSHHEIDIPVRDLDDATMLKVMANENASDWAMDTAVIMETVKATEKFLVLSGKDETKRRQRVLAIEITAFLGGVFSETIVEDALRIIHAVEKKEIDSKAVKTIPEPTKAATFVAAINSLPEEKKPSPEKQRQIAKDIVEKEIPKRQVKETVEFAAGVHPNGVHELKKALPSISDFVWEHRHEVERITKYLNALAEEKDSIPNSREWKSFRIACALLTKALNRLFGDDSQKGNSSHGTKKERRAIEQRKARASLTE